MHEEREIIELWQGQPLPEREWNVQAVITRAETFQRKIRRRNAIEYIAAAVLAAWAVRFFVVTKNAPVLVNVGVVLLALGGVVVAAVVRRKGHAYKETLSVTAPTLATMRWHRAELIRQRDLLRQVPLLYLAPFVPGFVVFYLGAWLASPRGSLPSGWWRP